jgi:hypothetical protein
MQGTRKTLYRIEVIGNVCKKIRIPYVTVEIHSQQVDVSLITTVAAPGWRRDEVQSPPTSCPTRFWPLLTLQLRLAFHTYTHK